MERRMNEPTFADAATLELGCPRTAQFFAKCDQFIPWQTLGDSAADVFVEDQRGRVHQAQRMHQSWW